MQLFRLLLSIFLFAIVFTACKKGFTGERKTIAPPETFMVVDTLFRSGDNRLSTRVDANWWGNSSGGIIVGYEVSTDSMLSWHFTTSQDSSFLLKIPPGQDSTDAVVYVRAIDNLGQKDPTPASTLYPIKNSKPDVRFLFSTPIANIASQNPTVVFPVLKYNIFGTDPDGIGDIKEFELCINDTLTTPFILPFNTSAFTLIAKNVNTDSSMCSVFINSANTPLSLATGYLRLNGANIIYIRVVDKALSKSFFVATPKVWVKKVAGNTLVINAYSSNKNFVQNFYLNSLKNIGINQFDTMQATEVINNNYTQLQPDFQTQSRTFALFKNMVWFGDDANFSLPLGQRSTADFFNKGGSLFMAIAINSSFDPLSNFLDWTPVRNLVNPPPNAIFRVNVNALVNSTKSGWPTIKSTVIIASARPFELPANTATSGYDSLYYGGIIESITGNPPIPWIGVSTVIAKRYSISGNKTNFVMSSLPLERFNGNNNTDSLFKRLLIDELGF
ncbi:MAG: hypothetical protein H7296_10925 [Bacteroidia bacterium]|nr:hypothetical protein [Bacteroidia bacterium]